MSVYTTVHNCHIQRSTKQFWWSSFLSPDNPHCSDIVFYQGEGHLRHLRGSLLFGYVREFGTVAFFGDNKLVVLAGGRSERQGRHSDEELLTWWWYWHGDDGRDVVDVGQQDAALGDHRRQQLSSPWLAALRRHREHVQQRYHSVGGDRLQEPRRTCDHTRRAPASLITWRWTVYRTELNCRERFHPPISTSSKGSVYGETLLGLFYFGNLQNFISAQETAVQLY